MYGWLLPSLTWLASATWMPVAGNVPFELPPWLRDPGPIPVLTADSAAQQHAATAVDLVVGFTLLYALYVAALRLARGRLSTLGVVIVLGVAVAAQAGAVTAPYAVSGDVYSYAMYGRIYAVHGGSPYLETPAEYPADPYFDYVYWRHVPSFYGPLWTLISGQVALYADNDVGLAVILFRLIGASSALAASVLALLLLRHIDPQRALAGAVLVAWSPLVIVESGLGAHNDVLMSLLVVFGLVLAWQRQWWFSSLSVGAVVLAGLVKATALALLPILGIYLLRRAPSWGARIGIVLISGTLAAGLGAAIVVPVWVGPATFAVGTLGSGADRYVNSPAEPVLGAIRFYLGATRDDLEVPLQFSGWWVGTHSPTELYAERGGSESLTPLPAWSDLVVVGPERENRLRVFDPVSRQVGYAPTNALGPIGPPAAYADDLEIQARIQGPVGWWDLQEANRWIRMVGWGAFGLALMIALIFGTRTAAGLAAGWVWLCLALVYVTLTWFWPWYVLWGLMPAALVPRSRLTRLTLYLGWGVLLAYALLGFQDTRFWFLQTYRAVPMFGLPLLLFLIDELTRGVTWLVKRRIQRAQAPAPISHEAGQLRITPEMEEPSIPPAS